MGKRPLSDFEDPRLHGEVNKADFEAILHISVLCVAKQSKGRPTIEVVFDELDKVYRDMRAREVYIHICLITPKINDQLNRYSLLICMCSLAIACCSFLCLSDSQ